MGGQYYIVGLPDPQLQDEAINLKMFNRNIQSEIEINYQLESLKYLRRDDQNQIISDLSMNNHKIVLLSPQTMSDHAVNKQFLDETVNDLARDLTNESQSYTDNLILQSAENRSVEIERFNFLINTEIFKVDSAGNAMQDLHMNEHRLSGI